MDIIQKVQELQEAYKNTKLKCNPSYAGTIPLVLELIELYFSSKYRNSDVDPTGWRKPFDNIVENPCLVTAKMIDFDSKDVNVLREDWQSWVGAYVMDRELKLWMKEKNFGKLLNETVYALPKYGHIVLKKVRNDIFLVPIGNMVVNPKKRWLKDMDCFAEKHMYSFDELRSMPWDKKKIETLIKEYEDKKVYEIECLEAYSQKEGFQAVAGMNISKEVLLYVDKDEKGNYKEMKFEDVPGRWLGRGVVERMFEPQQAHNESFCYLMKGLKWSSSHFFQTRDGQIKNNLLTDVEDGEIITALSEVNPIAMEERNLGAYQYIDTLLARAVQTRTFTQDVIRGDRPPSGTPLGTSQLQASMAGGYFGLKQEDMGIFWKEVIWDWVIPEFKKSNAKSRKIHFMKLLGEAAGDKIFNMIVDGQTRERELEMAPRKLLGGSELQMLRATVAEEVKQGDMELKENFYEDVKYKIDINFTGEQLDLASRTAGYQFGLNLLNNNPAILENPMTKEMFFKMLEGFGINKESFMTEFIPMISDLAQRELRQGGSMPRPATNKPQMTAAQINV